MVYSGMKYRLTWSPYTVVCVLHQSYFIFQQKGEFFSPCFFALATVPPSPRTSLNFTPSNGMVSLTVD